MAVQEDFVDLRQYFVDPIQHDYEVIRPIVLFAETAAERSRQTGVERTWWATKLDALSSKAWTASATGGRRRGTAGARLSRRHCRVYPLFKTTLSPHPFAGNGACVLCTGSLATRPIITLSNDF